MYIEISWIVLPSKFLRVICLSPQNTWQYISLQKYKPIFLVLKSDRMIFDFYVVVTAVTQALGVSPKCG